MISASSCTKVAHSKSVPYLRQPLHAGVRNDGRSWNGIILILTKTRLDIRKMSFAYSGFSC